MAAVAAIAAACRRTSSEQRSAWESKASAAPSTRAWGHSIQTPWRWEIPRIVVTAQNAKRFPSSVDPVRDGSIVEREARKVDFFSGKNKLKSTINALQNIE